MVGWWRWALVSPAGVVPSWMVGVSGSVNLPLHHRLESRSFLLAPAHPGGPGKRAVKWLCSGVVSVLLPGSTVYATGVCCLP